jgi:hypothetical protein
MAVTVKNVVLWRTEVENKPGVLAKVLEPLTAAGADFKVLMGYRYPGAEEKAAIEIFPVTGKKVIAAAQAAGLSECSISTLLVEGDDKPGLGKTLAQALAEAGINIAFLMVQVVGRKYSAVFGFDKEEDAKKAASIIKRAAAAKRK